MYTVTQTMRCRQALTDGVNEYGEKWLIVKCPLGAKVKLPAQPGGSFGCHNKTPERTSIRERGAGEGNRTPVFSLGS